MSMDHHISKSAPWLSYGCSPECRLQLNISHSAQWMLYTGTRKIRQLLWFYTHWLIIQRYPPVSYQLIQWTDDWSRENRLTLNIMKETRSSTDVTTGLNWTELQHQHAKNKQTTSLLLCPKHQLAKVSIDTSISLYKMPTRFLCPEPRCDDPEKPDNGRLITDTKVFLEGVSVFYECNQGYRLVGKDISKCTEVGSKLLFQPASPICESKR